MVSTVANSPSVKTAVEENLLTPRFYTTDFDKAAKLDLSVGEEDLQAMLDEMRADYNRYHFVRNEDFEQAWDHIQGEERQAFIDYWSAPAYLSSRAFSYLKNSPVG